MQLITDEKTESKLFLMHLVAGYDRYRYRHYLQTLFRHYKETHSE